MLKGRVRLVVSLAIFASLCQSLVLAAPNVFRDRFERDSIGDALTSYANSFSIGDGVLVASQLPDADHGAVTRAQLDFRDAAIDFNFKYDGGERFNFVVDGKRCKEVHEGIFTGLLFERTDSRFRMTEPE